jgi:hypothetical protein
MPDEIEGSAAGNLQRKLKNGIGKRFNLKEMLML